MAHDAVVQMFNAHQNDIGAGKHRGHCFTCGWETAEVTRLTAMGEVSRHIRETA